MIFLCPSLMIQTPKTSCPAPPLSQTQTIRKMICLTPLILTPPTINPCYKLVPGATDNHIGELTSGTGDINCRQSIRQQHSKRRKLFVWHSGNADSPSDASTLQDVNDQSSNATPHNTYDMFGAVASHNTD